MATPGSASEAAQRAAREAAAKNPFPRLETRAQHAARIVREARAASARRAAAAALVKARAAVDPFGSLDGADRDAAVALNEVFKSYGLETLAPQIVKMIQQGFSADTISIQLQQTKEYKERFSANEKRVKAGLNALSPAEYIATERSYRQVMSQAGLPIGFYDSNKDFEAFLVKDVAPTEVKARVDAVTEALNKAPKETLAYAKQFYNIGDLVAFALDPAKAQPLVEQRLKAAEAAAIAGGQGFTLNKTSAELIGSQGTSLQDIQSGLGFVGQEAQTTNKLSQIYGGDNVTTEDLVSEVFSNDGVAAGKRRKLASQERAAFTGSSGQTKTSLNRNGGGI
jgi:hypothetical protein